MQRELLAIISKLCQNSLAFTHRTTQLKRANAVKTIRIYTTRAGAEHGDVFIESIFIEKP